MPVCFIGRCYTALEQYPDRLSRAAQHKGRHHRVSCVCGSSRGGDGCDCKTSVIQEQEQERHTGTCTCLLWCPLLFSSASRFVRCMGRPPAKPTQTPAHHPPSPNCSFLTLLWPVLSCLPKSFSSSSTPSYLLYLLPSSNTSSLLHSFPQATYRYIVHRGTDIQFYLQSLLNNFQTSSKCSPSTLFPLPAWLVTPWVSRLQNFPIAVLQSPDMTSQRGSYTTTNTEES